MRQLCWFHVSVLAFLGGSLVACADPASVSGGASPESVLRPTALVTPALDAALAVETPRPVAEALVLYDRSLSGTVAADFAAATFVHVPVVDLLGQPFEDLVFARGVTPHPDGPYASCEDGALTVAVGATRAQMPVSWSRCGGDLQERIQALTDRIGGGQVDALVGAEASTYLLRTRDGAYWDVGDGSELTVEQVDELRRRYEDAWAAAETNGTLDLLQDAWASFETPEDMLQQYTRADGSLDLDLLIPQIPGPSILEQVEASGAGAGPTQVYSQWTGACYGFWFFGWHLLGCDHFEEGHHADPRRTQAHYPNQLSGFSVPACLGLIPQTNVAGCGPAAFASLTDWLWRRGQPLAGAGFSHGNEPHAGPWDWAPRPNQLALYQGVETAAIGLMASCGLGNNGTLTTPPGFFLGGNAWLALHAPGVVMNQYVSTTALNLIHGNQFAVLLRAQIGLDRGPIVAGFHIDSGGIAAYHYSPVHRYFVERPYLRLTRTRIESMDGHSSYLTNPWSLFSGLYWLEGNIGGCRFGDETYAWSCNGPIRGYDCTPVTEPSDPHGWNDNYFCSKNPRYTFAWSSAGPIAGSWCTQVTEPSDTHTWSDNYLCSNGAPFTWSSSWTDGSNCFRWSEPSDPDGWNNNFLCAP